MGRWVGGYVGGWVGRMGGRVGGWVGGTYVGRIEGQALHIGSKLLLVGCGGERKGGLAFCEPTGAGLDGWVGGGGGGGGG